MARQPAGRHPLAVGSLVLGLCFCGIALAWLLIATGVMGPEDMQVAVPGMLIGAGAVGIAASLLRGRNGRRRP